MAQQWEIVWTYVETHYGSITELSVCSQKTKKYRLKVYGPPPDRRLWSAYADQLVDFLNDSLIKNYFLVGLCNNNEASMDLYLPDELHLKYCTEDELKKTVISYEKELN